MLRPRILCKRTIISKAFQARYPNYPNVVQGIRSPSTAEYKQMCLNIVEPMLNASPTTALRCRGRGALASCPWGCLSLLAWPSLDLPLAAATTLPSG